MGRSMSVLLVSFLTTFPRGIRSFTSSSTSSLLLPSRWRPHISPSAATAATAAALASAATANPSARRTMTSAVCSSTNPLLESWTSTPFSLPPFANIEIQHYKPALEEGMKAHMWDLERIVNNADKPSFENVVAAYDRAGSLLSKVAGVYGNMCSSRNTDDLQQVQKEMSPILSRHRSSTYTLPGLFTKISKIHEDRHTLGLTAEQVRLVERIYLDFTRAGAHFDDATQQEYADIQARLATLMTDFSQNVLKDEETYELVLKLDDLSGCPPSLVEAAKNAAEERGKGDDEYVITTSRSLVEPFLTYSDRRDLRKIAFDAWTTRGERNHGSDSKNNLQIAKEMLMLRQQQAKLHGYSNFAEYQCVDRMAKTPQKVIKLLENVWEKAKRSADRERELLEAYCRDHEPEQPLEGGIQAWDWRYYAEKVRQATYDFDESLLKPYLSLEKVTDAVFAVSQKLYGLKYIERPDIPTYHDTVKVYEVRNAADDSLQAIFVHDNYARPFKSGGAWMSEYRSQTRNLPHGAGEYDGIPIVSNNNNFAKGSNTLLSFDDATTLFHEMGHGHHGMLSDCTYSRLSSTSVLTDFVELPSQLMEHWLEEPEVLQEYARHYETNKPVPPELLQKFRAARSFNQGFETIEYTACALLDMLLHQVEDYGGGDDFDITEFETKELNRLGMPQGIVMRHRPAHFLHLFASNSYAAGYYVYLWAEVLDADAYAAFTETGNIFGPTVAEKCRKYIYSSGNTDAPDELFRKFRGRDPDIQYMLEKKGLTTTAAR